MSEYYLQKGTTATINPPLGFSLLGVDSGSTTNKQFIIIQPEKGFSYYNQQFIDALNEGVISNAEYTAIIANQGASRQVYELTASYTFDKDKLINLIDLHTLQITTAGKTAPELTTDIIAAGYYVVFNPLFSVQNNFIPSDPPSDGIGQNFVLDSLNTAVLFKDIDTGATERTEHVNTLQAVGNADGINITIQYTGGEVIIIDKLYLNQTFINGALVTQVLATALTELNALFANTGGAIGKAPIITNSTTLLLTQGNSINFVLTGSNIVSCDFDLSGLPAGTITRPNYKQFSLIGGSTLTAGTYPIVCTAYNYFGQTSVTVNLVVSSAFTNTYSLECGAGVASYNAGTINNVPFYRPADGTGASDAWSVHFWYKMKSANKYDFNYPFGFGYLYGGSGCLAFRHRYQTLTFFYGLNTHYFTLSCSIPHGYDQWVSCLITYTGASTGTSLANAAAQFKVYIDGTLQTMTATQNAGTNGYNGSIEKSINAHSVDMCIGGLCSTSGTVKNSDTDPVDELAIWSSELTATDAATLYNSGTPLDLDLFTPNYNNWWRNGDGLGAGATDIINFPLLQDKNQTSGCDLTLSSAATVALYISDVP